MRRSSALTAALLFTTFTGHSLATAESRTGNGSSGGGPLAGVSAGIGDATRGGDRDNNRGGSSGSNVTWDRDSNYCEYIERDTHRCIMNDPRFDPRYAHNPDFYERRLDYLRRRDNRPDPIGYHGTAVSGFVNAHKVMDSDGALAGELSLIDRRFRLDANLARYYEREPSGTLQSMTIGGLGGLLRIDDFGTTHVFIGGGFVHARTKNDPVMDSTISGGQIGARIEQWLKPEMTLFGEVSRMFFQDDVRATSARAGIRIGHFQAGLRLLDFNVGPALWGPEIGVGF